MVNFRKLFLKQLTNGKIKHNNFIETLDEVLSETKKEGVFRLNIESTVLTVRIIKSMIRKCLIQVLQLT
jgi:hypothetical protein